MAKFEKITKYKNSDIVMPKRKTADAAGYDMVAAEDTLIPPYDYLCSEIISAVGIENIDEPVTISEMSDITKKADARPTLIPTGMKCKLNKNQYLELSVRSSSPLKYWIILANGEGIIDSDYYNNNDNEGHIMFQVINLSPLPIIIKKGEAIGQGIIKEYIKTSDDIDGALREGGFGSTTTIAQEVLKPAT